MKFAYVKELDSFVSDEIFESGDFALEDLLAIERAEIIYTSNDLEEFDTNKLRTLLQKTIEGSEKSKANTDFKLSAELHKLMSECGMNRNIASNADVWKFYTLFYCMEYVKWRFGEQPAKNRVLDSGKGIRNSLSRLWWWAEMTFDFAESDPYHLTKNSLLGQDTMLFAMDTIMPTNKKILSRLLRYIINKDYGSREIQILFSRARALNASRKIEFIDEKEISQTFDALMSFE